VTSPFSGHKFERLIPSEPVTRPRLLAHGSGSFRPSDQPGAKPVEAVLLDISVGGLGFRTAGAMKVGARVIMELKSVSGLTVLREAEVKWFVEDPRTRQTRAGCEWAQQLTDAELQLFVG